MPLLVLLVSGRTLINRNGEKADKSKNMAFDEENKEKKESKENGQECAMYKLKTGTRNLQPFLTL